ncbi:hypothetical protein [Tateyamaria sp.]|uniref:hypothetical protein n=1 Tax=Tateyamaria sp. TaxID=1929288 RepID=UPI003287019E
MNSLVRFEDMKMALRSYSLLEAARLLQETRQLIKGGQKGDLLSDVTSKGAKVAAGITSDKILVITGSRGKKDYAAYNLRPFRWLPKMNDIDEIVTANLPKKAFHKGFLLHAARVKQFLGNRKPSIIIGHSLGAASAQILGAHYKVPTIGLASPQVVKRTYLEPGALRSTTHPQWHVFNMAWKEDLVSRGLRFTGLRCLGHRVVVASNEPNAGIDHFVSDYERLIVSAIDHKVDALPNNWPDSKFPMPSRLA